MRKVGEEELSVLRVGRSVGRGQVIGRAAQVGEVRVRRLVSGDEVVRGCVEPSANVERSQSGSSWSSTARASSRANSPHAEVRRHFGAVADLVVVLDVVPVSKLVELVFCEELGAAEVTLTLGEDLRGEEGVNGGDNSDAREWDAPRSRNRKT